MRIANPIYDVVFKYLMNNNRISKILISKIIGLEIESIEFQPQEHIVSVDRPQKEKDQSKASFTVYRLDFAAKIKTEDGSTKQVQIEIQKAKFPTDIMRFRKYLGQQYGNDKNSIVKQVNNKAHKLAIPIITIYFLGHELDYTTAPVIKVNRAYIDIATGETLKNKEEFIESLTHDSFVIQIPYLKDNRRNELEKILSIFDQSKKESNHILNINESDYPEQYHEIIRTLQKAILDQEIQETMDIEDEIIAELELKEREIEDLLDSISEKEQELTDKDKELIEKNKELTEKNNELTINQLEIEQKKQEIEKQNREIERLKKILNDK